MAGVVRVKLTPEPPEELAAVSAALIELERFGGAAPTLPVDTPIAAQLVFFGAYLKKARGVSDPEFEEFARYAGKLEISEKGAVWRCDPEAEIAYSKTDEREPEVIRRLRLKFGPSFVDPPEPPHPAAELRLPEEPDGARFFELAIELKAGSGVEAERTANDRFDLPLIPFLQRLVLEWPDDYTERVPAGLTLTAETGSVKRSLVWEQGEVTGDMRRFVFKQIPLDPVSLSIALDDDVMQVWDEEDLTDPEREPDWLGWLEEFLDDIGPEDEEGEAVNQRDHQSAELDGRERTSAIPSIEV